MDSQQTSDELIQKLQHENDELRYGLSEFCRACEEAPPIQFMEWLDAAHKIGKDILERTRR
jgi:hypothetical protein